MTFILGLAGPDRVGKTSTALAMEKLHFWWCIRSWARPIRMSAAHFLQRHHDWFLEHKDAPLQDPIGADERLEAPIPELIGRTKRWFLQQWGTEFGRKILGPDVWVNMALQDTAAFAVFDDTRFPNEAARCDVVIELSRVGVDYPRNHESSHPLPDDYIDWRLELTPGKPEIDAERILNYLRREHGV